MICQRCAEDVPDIHTCSPSKLVRELEADVALWTRRADKTWHEKNFTDRITKLEAENAALKEENRKMDVLYGEEFNRNNDLVVQRNSILRENLELQHRIKQLREALGFYMKPPISQKNDHAVAAGRLGVAALSLPDATPELDALVRDAERLNWLESNPRHAQILIDGKTTDCVFYGISCAELVKLRDAIDAAMKETP